ncbi:regulator of chromosome condensation 1/beta-lactamase-inhibitor protein II [Gaertneriomyces semiglobifer]|nr:regulator of chromosome condensation 1/beta-lactamase-inhibitor protein II [Gaertneriomyces semiglobifer]
MLPRRAAAAKAARKIAEPTMKAAEAKAARKIAESTVKATETKAAKPSLRRAKSFVDEVPPVGKRGRKRSSLEGAEDEKVAKAPKTASTLKRVKKEKPRLPGPSTVVGEVFVCGSGDCGQLGLGQDVLEKEKLAKIAFFDDKDIVAVYAGGLHNIALDKNGKLYSWGCNDQKALGREGEETEPGEVVGLDGIRIVQVACGDSASAALSDQGEVYCWGTFRSANGIFGFYPGIHIQPVPFKMPTLENIVHISAGTNHLVAVGSDSKLYTWGVGEQGQLGHRVLPRHDKVASLVPRGINFRPTSQKDAEGRALRMSSRFVKAYCGGYCTFLVHETGAVFAYGLNNYSQLGLPDFADEAEVLNPHRVEGLPMDEGIAEIAGGEHHTLVLTGKGRIFSCGRNDSGQCGIGSTEERVIMFTEITGEDGSLYSTGTFKGIRANGAWSLAWGWTKQEAAHAVQTSENGHIDGSRSQAMDIDGSQSSTPSLARPKLARQPTYTPLPVFHPDFLTPHSHSGLDNGLSNGASASQGLSAVTRTSNNLYTWGYGDMGQLINGDPQDEESPFEVELKGRRVLWAGAGGQHFVGVLSRKNE